MKRIILLVLWILNSFLLSSQTSSNFNYAVEASICNGNTGKLSIAATSIGLDDFPLPWYIEIENQQNNDYKDYVMEFSEASIAELAPGMYSVIVWMDDLSGCYETFYINIPNNNQLEISADIHHLCFIDIYDGQIDLDIGEGIFQVDWYVLLPPWSPIPQVLLQSHTGVTNGSGAEDLTGIPVGRYKVHVIDSRGCYQEATYEVLDHSIHIALPDTIVVCVPGGGEIIPDVSGGLGIYEYLWSSGDTEEELYVLDAGIYTVTVTDEGGCSAEATVAFVASSPIVFADNFELHKPTSCESEDGYISTWRGGNISGGTLPYSYLWNTGSTNNSIGPVVAGIYILTVTDAVGCTAVKEQVLEAEYGIEVGYEALQPTCPGQATGSIELSVSQDVLYRCEQLDITVQDENNYLFIDNLEAGTYCFSIKSLDGLCEIERCYTITDIVSFEFLGVNAIKSCKFEKTGEAEVFHNYGSQISYIWKNIETNEIVSTSKHAKKLGQGRYSVNVKEFCGYNETVEIEIESDDFDVKLDIVNGCGMSDYDYTFDKYMGKFGTLNLTVNGMNPPYLVTLQDPDDSRIPIITMELVDVANFIQITDLWDTEYNITISDAEGCRYSNKFRFQSTIVSIDRDELIQPCSNGNDGVIKYDIFNPLGNQINVYYNEIMIFSTNNNTDVFFQTNQIKGVSKLIWRIGDCYVNTTVTLEGIPTEKRLYKYNKNTNKCHYDEYCNDEVLSKDTYLEDAFIDLADATTTSCNAPIYCGNIKVGVRDDKLTSIRGGEYYSLATSILPIHPYPQLINEDIQKVLSYGPCRIWYFCPLSMRLWGTSPLAEGLSLCNKLFPGTWGVSNIVQGSCVYMDCFCGPSLPPFCREYFDYPWGNPILTLENCLPISINVGRLLLMKDELQNEFKDYSVDTELGIFINEILTSYEKRRKALCSNIIFCRKDFTILYTDIDEPKLCGNDSNIKVTNNPNGYIISEAGKLEEISIPSAYYPNCILINSGFAICENSFPIVFCIEAYDENEPLPPILTPIICPIFFKDTVRTAKRILNCDDETVSLVYNEERDEFIHFWRTNEDADTIFLYGDIKNNNLFQKQNIEFPKIALAPGSKIYHADLINGSVYISNEFQNRYYFTRYEANGQLIWSKIFENDLVLKSNGLENGRIELLTYDKTKHKYKMLEISMEGQLSDTVYINTEISENAVIHVSNKSVFYYLQNEHKLILKNPVGQNIVISLPTEIEPKAIKSLSNGNILLAGNYKEGFYYEGEQINSNGYANVIFLQFTNNGSHVSSNIVPKERDEYMEGCVIKGNNEVAYYGKYIEAVYSYYDSTNIRIDSCIFTGIFPIDTTICTTFASELTIDEELCQLTWLPLPEDYITTMECLSADSIWTTAQLIEGQDGFTSPYYVTDDGIYRLVHRKVECPDVVSNEVNTSCQPISCPEIVRAYDEDDEEYQCYTFQIRHGENKEFRIIIRTWVYDTTALQFTDTVSFIVTDTSQIFSYCDMPEQYRCYNNGDIRILCDTCDSSCMQYYESWSCIPRTSTDASISDEYVKVRYYPNPFAGGVYLQYHSKASQQVAMSIYNSTGLLVLRKDIAIKEGDNLEYIKEIEALQPDVYTIQLKGESLINTSKVVKIR